MFKYLSVARKDQGEPWIGVRLQGGLGNQLFQFATAHAVAKSRGLPLRVDRAPLDTYGSRDFELERVLDPSVVVVSLERARHVFREQGFRFDPSVLSVPARTWLTGYFQSWMYFDQNRGELQSLILGREPDFLNQQTPVAAEPFIGLQVRRGDYLQPAQLEFHGICNVAFYKRGLALARRLVGNLPAVVFSDDTETAREFAQVLSDATPDDVTGDASPLASLRRLCSASAHVIANSSFGWWGAWLSDNSEVTVAPRPWFNDPSSDTRDLLPPNWLTLDRQ